MEKTEIVIPEIKANIDGVNPEKDLEQPVNSELLGEPIEVVKNVDDIVFKNIKQESADKISITDYAETQLKNKDNPLSEENRRIEFRISLEVKR